MRSDGECVHEWTGSWEVEVACLVPSYFLSNDEVSSSETKSQVDYHCDTTFCQCLSCLLHALGSPLFLWSYHTEQATCVSRMRNYKTGLVNLGGFKGAKWLSALMARFMGPTWGPSGPTGPRWVPCWSHAIWVGDGSMVSHTMLRHRHRRHGRLKGDRLLKCCPGEGSFIWEGRHTRLRHHTAWIEQCLWRTLYLAATTYL